MMVVTTFLRNHNLLKRPYLDTLRYPLSQDEHMSWALAVDVVVKANAAFS